jgi:hypothetical protein
LGGNFLSIDPVTTDFNTGDNFNRFEYANDSPYKFIDPDGRNARILVEIVKSIVKAEAKQAEKAGAKEGAQEGVKATSNAARREEEGRNSYFSAASFAINKFFRQRVQRRDTKTRRRD